VLRLRVALSGITPVRGQKLARAGKTR